MKGFAPVTVDTFENEEGPVEISAKMVHESKIYVVRGYNGSHLSEELHNMISKYGIS